MIAVQTWNDRPDGAGGKRRSGFHCAPPYVADLAALPFCCVAHGGTCRHHIAADPGGVQSLPAARTHPQNPGLM
jgi:hypothetical protein